MTTTMTMTMMITTRTGTITPAMTPILLLSIDDCVIVPSVIGVDEDGNDVVLSMMVVLEDVSVVISPGMDVCDTVVSTVGSVGVGGVPV